jgi:hypothetical protein
MARAVSGGHAANSDAIETTTVDQTRSQTRAISRSVATSR